MEVSIEFNKKPRRTGIDCPWSPYQFISYPLFIGCIIVLIMKVFPEFTSTPRIFIIIFYANCIALLFYFTIKLTRSDPTDPLVVKFKSTADTLKKDEIECTTNRFCNYCKSPVSSIRSKHCMRCNRCTSLFDHHCKFVNNCVGEINYRDFIKTIIVLQVHEGYYLGLCIASLLLKSNEISYNDIAVFLVIVKSVAVLVANGYLLAFHVFLFYKQVTTFEYISSKNEKTTIVPQNLPDDSISIYYGKDVSLNHNEIID